MTDRNEVEQHLIWKIKNLFSRTVEKDLPDDLVTVAEYYSFLSESIDLSKYRVTASPDLVRSFESVYLWLSEKMHLYPDSIRTQLTQIQEANDLCHVFAVLSSVPEQGIREARLRYRLSRTFASFFLSGVTGLASTGRTDDYIPSRKNLFDAKIALGRLSQILTYASSIPLTDYDTSFSNFRSNYDPELINKNKLFTLIHYMRVQADNIPESPERNKLIEKLDELETEIKRPSVRWGIVITGFFILFGFLADLNTLAPNIYNDIHDTAERVVRVIYEDGQVQKKSPLLLEESSQQSDDEPPSDPTLKDRGIKTTDSDDTADE